MQLCRHFGTCGGCLLQDVPQAEYLEQKRNLVVEALARAGVAAEVAQTIPVPPFSRRRADFELAKRNGEVAIGFHARRSREIVDMRECLVLTPRLTALVQSLRAGFAPLVADGEAFDVDIVDSETGFDLELGWKRAPAHIAELARLAPGIARITHRGEILVERARPTVSFMGARVKLPPGMFLQPTREGETMLQERAAALIDGAKNVADLFAGVGTFALVLARRSRVHAIEKDAAPLAVLAEAARETSGLKPVTVEKRDLFRRPLAGSELALFDAVLLDPPRAGAAAQVRALAASNIRKIVYVSCDAASFARDARILTDAGFCPGPVAPIDQFLWSEHIELVAGFARRRA